VEPAVVLGHSVGEYAAACVSGATGLEAGIRLVVERADQIQESANLARELEVAAQSGVELFLEVGPNATLCARGRAALAHRANLLWVATLEQGSNAWERLLTAAAQLYARGVRIDWRAFDRVRAHRIVRLPTYPFQRQRYWVDEAMVRVSTTPTTRDHSLLGQRFDSPALSGVLFTSRLGANSAAQFALDHRIFGVPILPGTGFIAMAFDAAKTVLSSDHLDLANLVFHEPLPLSESTTADVQVVVRRETAEARVEIFSRSNDAVDWTLHATADASPVSLESEQPPIALEEAHRGCAQALDPAAFYADLRRRGLEFGPLFRGATRLSRGANEAVAELALPEALHDEAERYVIHPVLLDACLQTVAAAISDAAPDAVFLPLDIDSCRIASVRLPVTRCCAHARLLSGVGPRADVLAAELTVYSTAGAVLASLAGIHFKRVNRATLARLRDRAVERWLIELAWEAERNDAARIGPAAVAARVRSRIAANSIATGWETWNEVEPQLDRICRGYVARALDDLGVAWKPGDVLEASTLANALRIKPGFTRLLERLLDSLGADGVVRREGSGWRVIRPPAPAKPEAELDALRARYPAFIAEITFTRLCGDELAAALTGAKDPLQLLFPGGDSATAEHLYRDSPSARLYNGIVHDAVVELVSTFPPDRPVRVLEIGGGTASTTAHVLPALAARRSEYLFTDISPLFVAKAAERFRSFSFFGAQALDIERDPSGQNVSGRFDIIIAGNVLHATRDLAETCANVRKLLAPRGVLVCAEITRPQAWIDLSFGLTDGWWRFTDTRLRPSYPLLTATEWASFLASQGFDEVAILPETEGASAALRLNAVMIARATATAPQRLLVLADRSGTGVATIERLRRAGHGVCVAYEGDRYTREGDRAFSVNPAARADFDRLLEDFRQDVGAAPQGVLHLWSIESSPRLASDVFSLSDRVGRVMGGALHLAQALIGAADAPLPTVWIATRGGVALAGQNVEPVSAALWGWARSLRLEHAELRCVSIDLDPGDVAGAPQALMDTLRRDDDEFEIAWRDRVTHVSRLRPARPVAAAAVSTAIDAPRELTITERGVLDNLAIQPRGRRTPGPREVEVRVRASGLNFRDVLNALGMYPGDPGPLGSEFAGKVITVGSDVDTVHVGDDVIGLAPAAFATHVIAGAAYVVPKPRELTYAQAAALPNVYLTAHWALHHLGDLKAGERVLIHAAAGGVGLAAVQLAKRAGAEVYATAGNEEKRAYLRSLGIEHVSDSRTLDFSSEITERTGGRGVDLVLNSLAGEFIQASFATLAPNGRFLEIGRTGIWSVEQVRARYPRVAYHVIDLSQDYVSSPEAIRPMLIELIAAVRSGDLQALPVRTFAFNEARAAFRFMAQARHVGKIVLTQPWEAPDAGITLRSDATYWITGGLTGLGLAVAEWLVAHGVTSLTLMGRRAPDDVAQSTLARLRALGAQILVVQGDVSIAADVTRAVASMRDSRMPRLAGVVHAAGVLDDGAVESQTLERYETVAAAKIRGAWLLREATRSASLDFFLLFSSAASLFGSAGQTNHGAVNAYLDAFAHSLRAENVPAISINWGAWSRIGAAAGESIGHRLREKGMERLAPQQGLAALEAVLGRAPPQIGVVAADWTALIEQLPAGVRRYMGALAEGATVSAKATSLRVSERRSTPSDSSLAERLATAPEDRRRAILQAEIRSHACNVLNIPVDHPIDLRSPLAGLGLDSLMAVELRNRLSGAIGRALPATLLFDHPTIEALCDTLARMLEIAAAAPMPPAPSTADALQDDLVERVAGLSDDELDRLLAEKLTAH
jgi:NADPH:quinone reductase-like Zn-dependent oxidoreductase/SAM-dependent methyltransferase/NADP-dependent 3-hydroxy acid dehydrogenase YdfG